MRHTSTGTHTSQDLYSHVLRVDRFEFQLRVFRSESQFIQSNSNGSFLSFSCNLPSFSAAVAVHPLFAWMSLIAYNIRNTPTLYFTSFKWPKYRQKNTFIIALSSAHTQTNTHTHWRSHSTTKTSTFVSLLELNSLPTRDTTTQFKSHRLSSHRLVSFCSFSFLFFSRCAKRYYDATGECARCSCQNLLCLFFSLEENSICMCIHAKCEAAILQLVYSYAGHECASVYSPHI